MSQTATLPILFGLGARILFSAFSRMNSPLSPFESEDRTLEYVVQGLFQGVSLQYAFAEYTSLAPALAFGLVARAFLDFSSGNNVSKFAVTLIASLVGGAASYILAMLLEDGFSEKSFSLDDDDESVQIRSKESKDSRRSARREHARSRLQEYNQRARTASPPRRDMSYITDDTMSSRDLWGYSGYGRLVDFQLANLRKRAATAEADRRRCKEEKKWALAQGNKSRATQLSWQIKRYAAMVESYTREADRQIIEATKAKRAGTAAPSIVGHDSHNPFAFEEESRRLIEDMNRPYVPNYSVNHGPSRGGEITTQQYTSGPARIEVTQPQEFPPEHGTVTYAYPVIPNAVPLRSAFKDKGKATMRAVPNPDIMPVGVGQRWTG